MRPKSPQSWLCALAATAGAAIVLSVGLAAVSVRAQQPVTLPPSDNAPATTSVAMRGVFAKCATCHGATSASRSPPEIGPGAVGDIASDPSLVDPGNPDGSPLYASVLLKQGAHEGLTSAASGGLTADDVAALRGWIEGLPHRKTVDTCKNSPLALEAVQLAAARALDRASAPARKSTRFVTLGSVAAMCATGHSLDEWRAAFVLALNGVSRSPMLVQPRAVDERNMVFAIELGDLGWSSDDWSVLAGNMPAAGGGEPAVAAYIAEQTGAAVAIVPAELLAAKLLDPEIYRRLTGVPDSLPLLLSNMRIDTGGGLAAGGKRHLVEKSQVLGRPRVVERHDHPRGPAWLAYTLGTTEAAKTLAESPAAYVGDGGVEAESTFGILPLRNGLPLFMTTDRAGIVQHRGKVAAPGYPSAGSLACAACHAFGPAHSPGVTSAPDPFGTAVDSDSDLLRKRLAGLAGQNRARATTGLVMVLDLARLAHRRLDLTAAAAIAGMSPAQLDAKLMTIEDGGLILRQQLQQGRLERGQLEQILPRLRGAKTDEGAAVASYRDSAHVLVAVPDKKRYRTGDLMSLSVQSTHPCHLTVINVSKSGKATVLLPNDYDPSQLLEPRRTMQFPGNSTSYQFRLAEPGIERIVALCNERASTADGFGHDFERLKFTELGPFDEVLRKLWNGEPLSSAAEPRPGRRGRSESVRPVVRPVAWTGFRVEVSP